VCEWVFSSAKIVSTGLAESDNKKRRGKNSEIPPAMNAATAITLCLCLTGAQGLFAQSAETPPVGFNVVECLPQSDTICAVPFARPAVFQGVVLSNAAGTGQITLTPEGEPNWTANAFQGFHFVRILSGAKAGMYYQVAANTNGTVTLDLAGDSATGFDAGVTFRIHPFWTLSTLFPEGTQTTLVASTGTLANQRRSLLLLPNVNGVGTNIAPLETYYVLSSGWRKTTGEVSDDVILFPDSYFIIRHNHATITASTFFTPAGNVELNPVTSPLATRSGGQQDNFVSSGRPIPVKVKDLDLITSGAFLASTSTLNNGRRDLLMVFDNSIPGINKAPVKSYYYFSGTWRRIGGTADDGDELIQPSQGLIIRKYQDASSATYLWTNTF
jgi:uncharacterized protein (TIGR02597 family)